jgi:hypothetical protein
MDVQIPTPDGHRNGTLHVPDGDGVLVFPDASGARETIRQMGDRLAGMGHVALIPDIYHRAGQWAPFDVATLFTDELLLLLGARKPTTTGRTLPACRTRTRHRPSRITHRNQPPQTRQPRERAHLHGIGPWPLTREPAERWYRVVCLRHGQASLAASRFAARRPLSEYIAYCST